ncbi:MAG TPA: hypothetical protein VJV23_08660, partial [Candidatus Polarisedimenticolia bacterium]|nr:hypothetical protein [Candidatus Polarisedimenticolia bacterium]
MTAGDVPRFAAVALAVVYAGLILALPAAGLFSPQEGIVWRQADALAAWLPMTPAPSAPASGGGGLEGEPLPAAPALADGEQPGRATGPGLVSLLASVPYAIGGPRGLYLVPALAALVCMLAAVRLAALALP